MVKRKEMTVQELILELQYQDPKLEVVIVIKGKEHREFEIEMSVPEYADPFVTIYVE